MKRLVMAFLAALAACGPGQEALTPAVDHPFASRLTALGGTSAAALYSAPTRCSARQSTSVLFVQISSPGASPACSQFTTCDAYAGANVVGFWINSFDYTGGTAQPVLGASAKTYGLGMTFGLKGTTVSLQEGTNDATCNLHRDGVTGGSVTVQQVGSTVVGSYSIKLSGNPTPLAGSFTAALCGSANACSPGYPTQCSSGALCCAAGTANCDGNQANGCEASLATDANNCGACGNRCAGGQTCTNGVCTTPYTDYGPVHSFDGMQSTHFITQGCCGVNCQNDDAVNAQYFCDHFYGQRLGKTCTPLPGYTLATTPQCTDPKMHKFGGCTSLGSDILNTQCDGGPCKIGNWSECTQGLTNLVCRCQ